MLKRKRLLLAAVVASVAVTGSACGSSGSGGSATDSTTTLASGGANSSATTTADTGTGSFGIGIATLKLDGNGHRIEFSSDEGTCEVDEAAGTAKVSVSKDGSTVDLDYDKNDPGAATIKFTGDGLTGVNGGAGASTPAMTDVVISDGEITGKATLDSPSEGSDKVYLGEFDILCP